MAAVERIQLHLPFLLLGLHPDNGSEFLNLHLLRWCRQTGILLSRPKHKNDNCHVEPKNWTLVRRLIGYQRLGTQGQLEWLDSLYDDLLLPYNNCFQLVMKLIGKESVGNQVRKHYDRPATPCSGCWSADRPNPLKIQQLEALSTTTSPLNLKRQIDLRLAAMPAALGQSA